MNDFQISVVIPVYNAARYVRQAVESALIQPDVAEVILVEDASPDESLSVCQAIAAEFDKVKLFQHPGAANRGAGPSRNLGIEKSNCCYIAFLDADDLYLPDRFSVPKEIFTAYPDCDGVYEALGIFFENAEAEVRWQASNMAQVRVTTVQRYIQPEDLFQVLMKGGQGHIHLNGLVIRRAILEKSGLMDESIADTLHEDTDFVMRLAAIGRLYPGRIDQPTSMRRVHVENRVSAPRPAQAIHRDKMRLRRATYQWCRQNATREQQVLAFRRMLQEWISYHPEPVSTPQPSRHTHKLQRFLIWPFVDPKVLLEVIYWLESARAVWAVVKLDLFKARGK